MQGFMGIPAKRVGDKSGGGGSGKGSMMSSAGKDDTETQLLLHSLYTGGRKDLGGKVCHSIVVQLPKHDSGSSTIEVSLQDTLRDEVEAQINYLMNNFCMSSKDLGEMPTMSNMVYPSYEISVELLPVHGTPSLPGSASRHGASASLPSKEWAFTLFHERGRSLAESDMLAMMDSTDVSGSAETKVPARHDRIMSAASLAMALGSMERNDAIQLENTIQALQALGGMKMQLYPCETCITARRRPDDQSPQRSKPVWSHVSVSDARPVSAATLFEDNAELHAARCGDCHGQLCWLLAMVQENRPAGVKDTLADRRAPSYKVINQIQSSFGRTAVSSAPVIKSKSCVRFKLVLSAQDKCGFNVDGKPVLQPYISPVLAESLFRTRWSQFRYTMQSNYAADGVQWHHSDPSCNLEYSETTKVLMTPLLEPFAANLFLVHTIRMDMQFGLRINDGGVNLHIEAVEPVIYGAPGDTAGVSTGGGVGVGAGAGTGAGAGGLDSAPSTHGRDVVSHTSARGGMMPSSSSSIASAFHSELGRESVVSVKHAEPDRYARVTVTYRAIPLTTSMELPISPGSAPGLGQFRPKRP